MGASLFPTLYVVPLLVIALLAFSLVVLCVDPIRDQLPDCTAKREAETETGSGIGTGSAHERQLVIVSTLDGKVWALDGKDGGQVKWSHLLGDRPLLSSTISDFEILSNGISFRLIPSLDGNLYKFNGEAVEPIALDADSLLRSSYKMGDDLVISGGKEVTTFGIDLMSGERRYECGFDGCYRSESADNESNGQVLMIKRHSHAVRAVEPRSGQQKWSFDVGEHQVSLVNKEEDCQTPSRRLEKGRFPSDPEQNQLKVAVADGLVSMVDTTLREEKWSQRLGSPVAGIWVVSGESVEQVNLFSTQTLVGLDSETGHPSDADPVLYMGGHEGHLYIQHSDRILKQLKDEGQRVPVSPNKQSTLEIEWKPRSVPHSPDTLRTELSTVTPRSKNKRLELDTSEYSGYYLFAANESEENSDQRQCSSNQPNADISLNFEDYNETANGGLHSIDQVIIVSLWHWWREVVAISVFSGVLINILITLLRKKIRSQNCPLLEDLLEPSRQESVKEDSKSEKSNTGSESLPSSPTATATPSTVTPSTALMTDPFLCIQPEKEYVSRYLTDFEPMSRLGKGGFGVVFKARNRIDDCVYAIKRIQVPFRAEAREKVMREVKALAKLDHGGIVRYYNSWMEVPPAGWQEDKDRVWEGSELSFTTEVGPSSLSSVPFVRVTSGGDHKDSYALGFRSKGNITFDQNLCLSDSYVEFERDPESKSLATEPTRNGETTSRRPGILSLCLKPKAFLYIQMQLCMKDTLREWLLANNCQALRQKSMVVDIFRQIVHAVDYVHGCGLMHRDLKPSNIFFSMDGTIKVGDFGLVTATIADNGLRTPAEEEEEVEVMEFLRHTDRVGTRLYMSPEQIMGASYSNKVDIFSLGVIFFELLVPFTTDMERIHLLRGVRKLSFPSEFCDQCRDECAFVESLLAQEPSQRPSTSKIKEHSLLKNSLIESLNPVKVPKLRTISFNTDDSC